MADVRKRPEKKKPYQVRYQDKSTKSGYGYKSFTKWSDANTFKRKKDSEEENGAGVVSSTIKTVEQAVKEWLSICENEGTDNQEPVTAYTLETYEYRAEFMKTYNWDKELRELQTPDIVNFRSWLLENCVSRDQARKVLSSFHTVLKEMSIRGHITTNPAADVSIKEDSRYKQPVEPPTEKEILGLTPDF